MDFPIYHNASSEEELCEQIVEEQKQQKSEFITMPFKKLLYISIQQIVTSQNPLRLAKEKWQYSLILLDLLCEVDINLYGPNSPLGKDFLKNKKIPSVDVLLSRFDYIQTLDQIKNPFSLFYGTRQLDLQYYSLETETEH
jgi:hypothetical protein